jgi:hypothetical protein
LTNYNASSTFDRAVTVEPKPNPLTNVTAIESPSLGSRPAAKKSTDLALTSKDRLVFLAVQNFKSGITEHVLPMITRLDRDVLQSSITVLQSQGLITSNDGGEPDYYAIPSFANEPLQPHWEDFLSKFWREHPPIVEGDTLGTRFISCGTVLLVAMISGCCDEHRIAWATTFPLKFVRLILQTAEDANVWGFESAGSHQSGRSKTYTL